MIDCCQLLLCTVYYWTPITLFLSLILSLRLFWAVGKGQVKRTLRSVATGIKKNSRNQLFSDGFAPASHAAYLISKNEVPQGLDRLWSIVPKLPSLRYCNIYEKYLIMKLTRL